MQPLKTLALGLFVVSTAALAQQGPPRGPPPEALQACSGLSEGAACAFTHREHELTGTCRTGPQGGALACAPAGMGPGAHRGPPPAESVAACQARATGASCSFSFDGRAHTGTCGPTPDGASMACRPARPEGGPHGPPPEALAACASSSAGAACTVTIHGQPLSGTCVAGPSGEALACHPPRP